MNIISATRLIEAILLTAPGPVSAGALREVLPECLDLEQIMGALQADYTGRGFAPVQTAGGWCFRTDPSCSRSAAAVAPRRPRLSRAAQETLAIVALFQPVTRSEIERVRGVGVAKGTIDLLMLCDLIRPGPRRESPGHPLTWMTTPHFLECFDLTDPKHIPGMEAMSLDGILDLIAVPPPDADASPVSGAD